MMIIVRGMAMTTRLGGLSHEGVVLRLVVGRAAVGRST